MTCFSTSSQFQFAKSLVSFSTFNLSYTRQNIHTQQNNIQSFRPNVLHIGQSAREIDMIILSFEFNLYKSLGFLQTSHVKRLFNIL